MKNLEKAPQPLWPLTPNPPPSPTSCHMAWFPSNYDIGKYYMTLEIQMIHYAFFLDNIIYNNSYMRKCLPHETIISLCKSSFSLLILGPPLPLFFYSRRLMLMTKPSLITRSIHNVYIFLWRCNAFRLINWIHRTLTRILFFFLFPKSRPLSAQNTNKNTTSPSISQHLHQYHHSSINTTTSPPHLHQYHHSPPKSPHLHQYHHISISITTSPPISPHLHQYHYISTNITTSPSISPHIPQYHHNFADIF